MTEKPNLEVLNFDKPDEQAEYRELRNTALSAIRFLRDLMNQEGARMEYRIQAAEILSTRASLPCNEVED